MQLKWRLAPLVIAAAGLAAAGPIVTATVDYNSDGSFTYNLTVKNNVTIPDCPLAGLLILKGDTVFGLNIASEYGSPTGWSVIPPVPMAVDDLAFFSDDPANDIQPGDSLDGFSFNSLTNPHSLKPGDFAVEVICRTDGRQISAGNAFVVPEPSGLAMAAVGFASLAALARRRYS